MAPMTTLREQLRDRMRTAMRERDRSAVSLYRTTLAAIDNAEALPVDERRAVGAIEEASVGVGSTDEDRLELTEAEVAAVVRREATERRTAAETVGMPEADRIRLMGEAGSLEALVDPLQP